MKTFLFLTLHLSFFIAMLGVDFHEENSRDADAELNDLLGRWSNLPTSKAQ